MSAETTSMLNAMRATVAEAVEQSVQWAMQLLAARLDALSMQVEIVQSRVADLESRMLNHKQAATPSAEVSALMQVVTSLEREAKDRYVTFVGFNASCSHEAREKAIREFLGKQCAESAHKVEHVGSHSQGPQENRTMSAVSFVEFSSAQAAALCLRATKDKKLHLGGIDIDVKPPRSLLQQKRNMQLKDMEKKAKESTLGRGGSILIDWKKRAVLCNGREVYVQERDRLAGSWLHEFASMG